MDFNSENDEEIDEDLAFDEEDEDRWGDYFNSQPSKKVVGSDKKGKRKLKDEVNDFISSSIDNVRVF
jgi:U3 small nucleolar RNA-associated protein 14